MIIILRKKRIVLFLSIALVIAIMLSIGWDETVDVLGYTAVRPIYKDNPFLTRVAFECNVVWGTEYVPAMLDLLKERTSV